MWVDEREASKLWCPQSRVYQSGPYGDGAVNRGSTDVEGRCCCRGKGCTAWRWGHLIETDEPTGLRPEEVGANPEKYANKRFKPRKGYCGLAGKPKD